MGNPFLDGEGATWGGDGSMLATISKLFAGDQMVGDDFSGAHLQGVRLA